ncbi:Peptidase S24/S26A/S26B, conserved region [Paenibacillus curdlanolyticus YK9]|uniref:Signal peptidase I n=1 Tax=Paenibacillus curdlanolyticus YK9 TaxID=717606 RepID=E0I7T6_9BACL|nr:signal peptidase I [Paenibacillus curdlanolyticus]EFM11241.1 Peptidase S24/S26A/S26B, conserved region [Paenibacillus curdlanolyticus YK9]
MNLKTFIIVITLLLITAACTKEEVIVDNATPEDIPFVAAGEDDEVITFRNDSMVRKLAELYDKKLVVSPDYYKTHEMQRGDIIQFRIPDSNTIPTTLESDVSRVIGLEGETVSLKKGQIYINNKRLDTFYGMLMVDGLRIKEFSIIEKDPGCAADCLQTRKQFFDTKLEVKVPTGSVFIIADNPLRGLGSMDFGPLDTGNVLGKVVGIKK